MRCVAALALVSACGRVSFTHDDAPRDGAALPIEHVKVFAQRHPGAGATDIFSSAASAAGNAVVIQVGCADSQTPGAVSISAPGWTFQGLGPIVGTPGNTLFVAAYGAVAPDTQPATFTITWAGVTCNVGTSVLADEFTNNDPAGGATTFDAHAEGIGTGDATAVVTQAHDGDAIWGACLSTSAVLATGAGYTKGADNGGGDWAEYKLTTDPAGTPQDVRFTNTSGAGYRVNAVAIKPRA